MYLANIYTVTASLAGICGVKVLCSATKGGLPIGMQVLARHVGKGPAFPASAGRGSRGNLILR